MNTLLRISQQDGINVSSDDLSAALSAQRERFLNTFGSFTDEQWAAPTRCSEWDAHTTMRHLTDAAESHASGYTGERIAFMEGAGDFNPQTTPDFWLAASNDDSPADTLARYERVSAITAAHAPAEVAAGSNRVSSGPYGKAHWSVITIHVMWDAWLHERDILAGATNSVPTIEYSPLERNLVSMYAVLMSTVPPLRMGDPLEGSIRLDHDGSVLCARFGGAADHVVVEQTESAETTDVQGDLLAVADALGGRGEPIQELLTGDAGIAEKMSFIGQFI